VVDGYNLLNCSRKWQRLANRDLTLARTELLRSLSQYQAYKKHPILVVFDGGRSGWPTEQREQVNNINIIYSRRGEQADEVIKRVARDWGEAAVVVTSDRELADSVTRSGATVISAGQFEAKLRISAQAGGYMEVDDEPDRPLTTRKRGTAYRRSKQERRRQAKLRKL
jgi:hypothetical protein